MKRVLRNKLRMFLTVRATCVNHQGVWENISNFADLFEEFDTNLTKIGDEMTIQSSILEGKSESKSDIKDELAKITMIVIGVLRGYAKKAKDSEVRAKLAISESAIQRGRDAEVSKFCEMVYAMAEEFTAELTEMGKDLSILESMKEKIDEFNKDIVGPRTAIGRRKIATDKLDQLFDETMALLREEMDAVAKTFQDDESGFYEEYFSSRQIINLKGQKSSDNDESESDIENTTESPEVDPTDRDQDTSSSQDEAA